MKTTSNAGREPLAEARASTVMTRDRDHNV
jgi:hypothetical protein